VDVGLNLRLKSLFFPQSPPPQRIQATPPLCHSARNTADKKDGGQARQNNGGQVLDLLTIALKTDSNKPNRAMQESFCIVIVGYIK
jgi:hypothetical protein